MWLGSEWQWSLRNCNWREMLLFLIFGEAMLISSKYFHVFLYCLMMLAPPFIPSRLAFERVSWICNSCKPGAKTRRRSRSPSAVLQTMGRMHWSFVLHWISIGGNVQLYENNGQNLCLCGSIDHKFWRMQKNKRKGTGVQARERQRENWIGERRNK